MRRACFWGMPCLFASLLLAAEPPRPGPLDGFADPAEMFQRMFGQPSEEQRKALETIPVSIREETRMGEAAVKAYLADLRRQGVRVVSRGQNVEYLRDLVDTIRPLMKQGRRYPTIRIYVAQSSVCDARSFPGGTLIFFRGLLELADSEAAVAGIVGHELSHLDRGHQLLRVRRVKLAEQTFSGNAGGFTPQRFMAAGTNFARLWTRPFQPEAETEADRDGATWAYRAGYDPREMAKLFLKLRKGAQHPAAPLPDFLRSYPLPENRHRQILDLYGQLQQAKPSDKLYRGRENLRRRISRSRREFKE